MFELAASSSSMWSTQCCALLEMAIGHYMECLTSLQDVHAVAVKRDKSSRGVRNRAMQKRKRGEEEKTSVEAATTTGVVAAASSTLVTEGLLR